MSEEYLDPNSGRVLQPGSAYPGSLPQVAAVEEVEAEAEVEEVKEEPKPKARAKKAEAE